MSDIEIPRMTETKIEATRRLRSERRWGTFEKHRIKCVERLKKELGGSKSDVNDDAWALALAAFPPLKVGDGCDSPSSSSVRIPVVKVGDSGSTPGSEPSKTPPTYLSVQFADAVGEKDSGNSLFNEYSKEKS